MTRNEKIQAALAAYEAAEGPARAAYDAAERDATDDPPSDPLSDATGQGRR